MKIDDGLFLEKYRIEKLINNGSFASVFRAKEELTNRTVAIKALSRATYPPGRMRYLLTELSAMGMNWGHPNIVSLYTVEPGDDEYVAYIVMEYIDGSSLRQLMNVKPPPLNWALNIALDICRGLTAAHERNIIHRDIKPQNILLTSNRTAKISDFGVSRILETANEYAGTLTGTRKYMAPEQYEGNYDYRADLYSTGLILYEMLTGRFPFRGKDHDEIQLQKQGPELDFSENIPDTLREFLRKALHRDVKTRYQNAAEMYDALDSIRQDRYTMAVRETFNTYSSSGILDTQLTEHREDLRLPTETAEKIEQEIQFENQSTDQRKTQRELEGRVSEHYKRAAQYAHSAQPQQALQEMQQAHRLYLTDIQATRKADGIFKKLTEAITPKPPPTTALEMIQLMDELPADEMLKLKEWFYEQFPPIEPSDSSLSHSPLPMTTSSGTTTSSKPAPLPVEEITPESLLLKLHEDPRYMYENQAALLCKSAYENAQQGRRRKALSEYKKLGRFYRDQAQEFIKSQDWELVADCYARSRLAYMGSDRLGSARQSAYGAAIYYTKLAEELEKRQDWAEAGRFHALSAEHYTHAEFAEKGEDCRLNATICYLNVAEDAHAEGNLKYAYDYCDKTVAIAQEMQSPSKAAAEAKKLMKDIEARFMANLGQQSSRRALPK